MNIIGIDLGGTKLLGIRADEDGKVLQEELVPTLAHEGPERVIDRILSMIGRLAKAGPVDAIGIDVPGPADPFKGIVYGPPNLPGWPENGVPLLRIAKDRLGYGDKVPLALVNDANASALAEYKYGAGAEKFMGKKIKHLVFLTISTGIGGGVIVDGKLLLGANGFATELGHVIIDAFGYRCSCGSSGCFEAMASGTALAREGALIVASRRPTLMSDMVGGDPAKVDGKVVSTAAAKGDPAALALMAREGMLVGVGVTNFIHTFNPEVVVLGGGVTHAGDLLFVPARAAVEMRIMPAYRGTFEIVSAVLGDKSAALGAVAAAVSLL